MIKKLVSIKNLSKYISYNSKATTWDGCFKKNNIIFGSNGSGKTTLSLIFRSLKGQNEILMKKKSFNVDEKPMIKMIDNNNKLLEYKNYEWNENITKIEIFDSFYAEDNIYQINTLKNSRGLNLFEALNIEEIQNEIKEIKKLERINHKLCKHKKNLKQKLKRTQVKEIKKEIAKSISRIEKNQIEINRLNKIIIRKNKIITERFKDSINNYLLLFCENIKIIELHQLSKTRFVYDIKINGKIIKLKEDDRYSLKYILSEGDKNALALSFFLAKLNIIPNIEQYIIIIDDPFTSFDLQRQLTTILQLVKISKKVEQLFLLTHDINFAKKFSEKENEEKINLCIKNINNESIITLHDIEKETLQGIYKDLTVLNNYLQYGEIDCNILRETVRCIRPTIEGFFRLKYFTKIGKNEWLGDIIKKIKLAQGDSPFRKHKSFLEELIEINEYSKIYHHSNPNYLENPINPEELKIYVKRTLNLIEDI